MIARCSIVAVALALSLSPVHAETARTSLSYRMLQGDSYALNIAFDANVPTQGQVTGTANIKSRVEAVLADFLRLKISVAADGTNLAMGEDLSAAGNASNITGVNMSIEKDAMIAKNVASLAHPALPDSDVVVGQTWESERPVYLPKAPMPGVPTSARVRFVHTVQSITQENGREVVRVAVTGKEPAGQSVKIKMTGFWVLAAGTGKPLRAHFEGEATMRIVFQDFKLPFKVDANAALTEMAAE